MERTIKRVVFPTPRPIEVTRVAAYARVSSGKDAMLHSLSAQVSYYSSLIQKHPGWLYCGVYADEALTGTKDSRENFQRLLTACRNGEVDLVITKSISRFARNTVTLLQSVRELKELGVDVYFEEQNIHTMSADGELMLTILASYAQEESRSASENQKWRIQKNFQSGKPWNGTMLGYRYDNGTLVVVPEEAEIVRRVFREYLSGKGVNAIARELNADGVPTRRNGQWCMHGVQRVLENYAYTGNLLLQKTFRENHLSKLTLMNDGLLPMYHVEGAHEAIIDLATFSEVQEERKRRAKKHIDHATVNYPYTKLIVCGCCGKHYRRKHTTTGHVWICGTFNQWGKAFCSSKQIPEPTLDAITKGVDLAELSCIRAEAGNTVRLCYKDGTEITKHWTDRSRSQSWTPEMRAEAGRRAKERRRVNA